MPRPMAKTLDLKQRKETPVQPSSYTRMEPIPTSLEHDFFLAMISVIPAAILWIAFDHLFLGIMLGAAIFVTAEYTYPAYRAGRIDFSSVIEFSNNVRTMIRTRVALPAGRQGRRA